MVSAKKKAKHKSRPKFRASWKGQLRFGLVSFEVQAINAQVKENAEVHFHLLHAPDHRRIHYAKICPVHGEVSNDEIVEGYEYGKGRYVEFEKEELDALRTEREKALTIDAFVAPDQIDPIYFDGRMYFLLPSGPEGAEPYALLVAAMEKLDRWGVGQVVFSGREQLVLVRPLDGLLNMAMLNYELEIRKVGELKKEVVTPRTTGRKLKLAQDLIRNWTQKDFDFSSYTDHYREKVKRAVKAKIEGTEVVTHEEEEEPQVVNLMDALKRSLDQSRAKQGNDRHRAALPRKTRKTKKAS